LKIKIFFILFLLTQQIVSAKGDSLGIYVHTHKLTLTPNYGYTNMFLKIYGEKTSIQYSPSASHSIGLEATYKWLGIGFGIGVFDDENNELQNKLVNYDFRFDFFFRRFFINSNFQYFKGFSVKDPPQNLTPEQSQNITPNMELTNIGLNFIYAFNKNFSFKAIYKNSERLKYSRGSFLVGLTQFYTRLSSKTTFYPDEILSDLKIKNYSSYGKFYSIFLDVGYQYAFVRKRWYVAPILIVGGGTQYQNYIYKEIIHKSTFKAAYKYIINIPMGYNGDKFFYGLTFNFDNNRMLIENARMQLQLTSFKLFFGMRFL